MIVLFTSVFLPAQGNAQEDDFEIETYDYDPIESVNRVIYEFNYTLDGLILKPVAQIYRGVVPEIGRKGISNVLDNLYLPVTFANSVLQLDPKNAGDSFGKFLTNSTFGLGGLIDVAGSAGVTARKEDFGQTLGTWGVPAGPYIVLPFMGPSNLRDAFGNVVDMALTPHNWIVEPDVQYIITGINAIDTRSENIEFLDSIYDSSIDSYATIRTYYQQRRARLVTDSGNGARVSY
jgi:phospholipid-binding lipoprotein MlaA